MKKYGFTLIELLIVVSVIGVLSAVLIAVINPTRQRNRASEVVNAEAVRKLASAVEAFTSVNGKYPTNAQCRNETPPTPICGGYLTEWPKSEPNKSATEIVYATSATYGYYVRVPSKLYVSPQKYLCYKGNAGKVYKDCNSGCNTVTGYTCTEGVL